MAEDLPTDAGQAWFAAMRRGDWPEAWRQTDRIELPRRERQARPGFAPRPEHLHWDGTPFDGRSVLVRCEHGLGDTVQFIRFVPQLGRIARAVTVLVQPHLLELFAGAPGLGTVRNGWTGEPAPPHDTEIEIMELPYALRATLDSLPSPYPHLAERVAGKLAFEWPRDRGRRVGLLWNASEWDDSRSIPLALLEPLVRVPHLHLFSLQQGPAAADPMLARWPVIPLSRHTAAISSAAAALLELDLTITVDNMMAHLAGTAGCPTWVLLKRDADWRWMEGRADSPWYPGMRLFRQPSAGDWRAVVAAAAQALSSQAHAPSP